MIASDLPFVEVTDRSGFGGQSQLHRAIKADTGMTPTKLRGRHRSRTEVSSTTRE